MLVTQETKQEIGLNIKTYVSLKVGQGQVFEKLFLQGFALALPNQRNNRFQIRKK